MCAVVLVGVAFGLAQRATGPSGSSAPTASTVATASTLDPEALSIGTTKVIDTDSYTSFCENNSDLCTLAPGRRLTTYARPGESGIEPWS